MSRQEDCRIVVLGGYGHFGARIVVCALPAAVGSGTVYAVTRRDDGNRALQAFLRTAAQIAARPPR